MERQILKITKTELGEKTFQFSHYPTQITCDVIPKRVGYRLEDKQIE